MGDLSPTAEQLAILDLFAKGGDVGVEAGAGTGKTSTCIMLAESDANRRGQYVAFNKAIVVEASTKMPANVAANTMHSLAYRAKGTVYAHRLNAPRMRSAALARALRVEPIFLDVAGTRKPLQPGYLASLTMRAVTRFCQSADDKPSGKHVPYVDGIDLPTPEGRRTFYNNNIVASALEPVIARAWEDVKNPHGQLPFRHDHYLKLWQLDAPYIAADFILYDEAQDADPVQLAIVAAQDHAQVVYVGDSQQQIYDWRGAINALAGIDGERAFLSQSFRFGGEIAQHANRILERLGAELRLSGLHSLTGRVGPLEKCDAILTRTNAKAMSHVLRMIREEQPVHLMGGGGELLSFARASDDLRNNGWTSHPELACFTSWGEVQDYVANDPQGSELKLLVELVDEYGTDVIEEALGKTTPEGPGVVTVSTAHKAKGREWDRVKLADDFEPKPPRADTEAEEQAITASELRLLYVAVTRARREVDSTVVPWLNEEPEAVLL